MYVSKVLDLQRKSCVARYTLFGGNNNLKFFLKGRERERQMFLLLVCHSRQCWARQKVWSWDSFQPSHVGGRASALWASTCCLPKCAWAGNCVRQEEVGAEPGTLKWDVGLPDSILPAPPDACCSGKNHSKQLCIISIYRKILKKSIFILANRQKQLALSFFCFRTKKFYIVH